MAVFVWQLPTLSMPAAFSCACVQANRKQEGCFCCCSCCFNRFCWDICSQHACRHLTHCPGVSGCCRLAQQLAPTVHFDAHMQREVLCGWVGAGLRTAYTCVFLWFFCWPQADRAGQHCARRFGGVGAVLVLKACYGCKLAWWQVLPQWRVCSSSQ